MSPMRYIDRLQRRSVVLHLKDGQSLKGVLMAAYRDSLVLAHARYLAADGELPVDGEAVVPRDSVAWLQTLPAQE